MRSDVRDALRHHFRLVSADGLPRRDDLPVQVRDADHISVHELERPDAAPRQRFRHIPADAADAKNHNPAVPEPFHRFSA